MEKNVLSYFQAKLNSLMSHPELEALKAVLISKKNRLCSSLSLQNFKLKTIPFNVPAIQTSPKINKKIHENRLKNALQLKLELENQLKSISKSISSLQKPKTVNPLKKKHALSASQLKENKRFFNLSRKTENFLKQQRERLKKKVKILEENDLVKAQRVKEMREQVRKEELEKLKKKREERQKLMKSINKSKICESSLFKEKPLFLKFEDNYRWKFEVPELERRKMELREKKKYFKPIDRMEFKEHEEWYEGIKREKLNRILEEPRRGRTVSVNNLWRMKILEEEKRVKEERMRKEEVKIKMFVNKIKYSELIRELHAPFTPDKREKSHESKKTRSGKIFNIQESEDDKHSCSTNYWKPHKFALNPMLPQQKPVRLPKPIYYLEEKRNIHKPTNINLSSPDIANSSLSTFNKVTKNLEDLAHKKEIMSEIKPFSTVSIQRSVSADNLLLKSIKAKINLINKNS